MGPCSRKGGPGGAVSMTNFSSSSIRVGFRCEMKRLERNWTPFSCPIWLWNLLFSMALMVRSKSLLITHWSVTGRDSFFRVRVPFPKSLSIKMTAYGCMSSLALRYVSAGVCGHTDTTLHSHEKCVTLECFLFDNTRDLFTWCDVSLSNVGTFIYLCMQNPRARFSTLLLWPGP